MLCAKRKKRNTMKTAAGKSASSQEAIAIQYDATIQAVDDLLRGSTPEEFVAPGLIDLQVNGFAGVDYNDPRSTPEAIAGSIRRMFTTGVTRFFATVITAPEEHICGCLRNLARAREEFARNGMPEGAALEAFHVEGPHISPEDGPRGAHPLAAVRPPDIDEFARWQEAAEGNIRLVTVSPEWENAPKYISVLVRAGVVASIGHTKASGDQIRAATDAGATVSTHLGNGAHQVLPKTQNYIFEQLAEDRLAACFILDGIHLPPVFFKAASRAKGLEKCILVTDAVMPAMCAPGKYQLGSIEVELRADQSVVLQGTSRLAGAALRMDHAVQNSVRFGEIPLSSAISLATINPARIGRIAGRQRGLVPGEKADLIRFRWDSASRSLMVCETIVGGASVYNN